MFQKIPLPVHVMFPCVLHERESYFSVFFCEDNLLDRFSVSENKTHLLLSINKCAPAKRKVGVKNKKNAPVRDSSAEN